MKSRIMGIILVISLCLMLAACGGANAPAGQEPQEEASPSVQASLTPEAIARQGIPAEMLDLFEEAGLDTGRYGGVIPRNGFWMPYYYGCLLYFDGKDVQIADPDRIYLKAVNPDGTLADDRVKANAHMDGSVLFIAPAEYREGSYEIIFERGALTNVKEAFYACSGKIRLAFRAPVEGHAEDVEVLPLHEGDRTVGIAYNSEHLDYVTDDHMTDMRMHLEPEDTKWVRWDSYLGLSSSLDDGFEMLQTTITSGADGRKILELPLPEGLKLIRGEAYVLELLTGFFVEKDGGKPVKHDLLHVHVQ